MHLSDLDRTPVFFPPLTEIEEVDDKTPLMTPFIEASAEEVAADLDDVFNRLTPSMPLPLTRRTRRLPPPPRCRAVSKPSWDPPPLRKLLESTPPPPRMPMRSELELECARMPPPQYGMRWDAVAAATTSTLEIDWNVSTAPRRGRRVFGWVAAGAAYALGITTVVAIERQDQHPIDIKAMAQLAGPADLPALAKVAPLHEPEATAEPIVMKQPLHIIGFVTDPPARAVPASPEIEPLEDKPQPRVYPRAIAPKPTPKHATERAPTEAPRQEIDLARLRVIVGGKAVQAAGCGGGKAGGASRVSITFAPSGHATSASVVGPHAGTAVGSCIASVMRSAVIPPFAGSHTTVTKTVRLAKKKTRD